MLSLPDCEERWVRKLFERAVGSFYDVVLSSKGWKVGTGGKLSWQIEARTPGIDLILPSMRTDIVRRRRRTTPAPPLDRSLDETIIIQGRRFRFMTVNLAADTSSIRAELLRAVHGVPPTMGT